MHLCEFLLCVAEKPLWPSWQKAITNSWQHTLHYCRDKPAYFTTDISAHLILLFYVLFQSISFFFSYIQPNNALYESFSVFCPCDQIENLDQLEQEDVLIDWSQPIYLNFTNSFIIERMMEFQSVKGVTNQLAGDIYVLSEPPPPEEDEGIKTWVK